jgi:thiamine-monophosphate kinase
MAGPSSLGEFDLIARYLAPLSQGVSGSFNLTDDAATVSVPAGCELVVTTDAMIEGIHFLAKDGPERIARKLLRVNLSDLAAKGAKPVGYQLVLGLPGVDEDWLARFCAGLAQEQAAFGIVLHGGDTVRSPDRIVLSVTAFGHVPVGGMIRRGGAQAGEGLYVTGSIGDAALGLEVKLNHRLFSSAAMLVFDSRLHLPTPRVAFGQALKGIASAAMDVSDGLVQDAGHLAATSGLQAIIQVDAVPLSLATRQAILDDPRLLPVILTGGEDYELLFSIPPSAADRLAELSKSAGLAVTRIGQLQSGSGVTVVDARGQPLPLDKDGFQHFGAGVD